ncbi:dipeptidase [Kriegella aquimaris]|uniref:Membrane dipeptidase n=1 Tax=Kriegella aquimaris TaxID=192904 RepID=A0A1G9VIC0_9FLAO|nr:membrane dipeptidase [Kriegella aquimaris]SDM71850.1 membrane dipeptidase [Kriegella aquimaris]
MTEKRNFIIDAHLDLATNAMTLNRDLTRSVHAIRKREKDLQLTDYQDRGNGTVAFPEMREGNIGLVFTTMISRVSEQGTPLETMALTGWNSPRQAYANAQCQLQWYRQMEESGELAPITTALELKEHCDMWISDAGPEPGSKRPIGYILALEGADSIVDLDYLHRYYQQGLRSIGLSHFGPGRYAAGTHSDGSGLTPKGFELLREMNQLKILLDTTHLTDKGFFEALETFDGRVLASHQNCRGLVPGERQFSDDQLKLIIERNGVIGGALDTWMLAPDFKMGVDSPRQRGIDLEKIIDHFDHICQLAGNSDHIGIGSDLDGLFGLEQTPYDMDTIADIQKLSALLEKRGYTQNDMDNIFFKNWLNLLNRIFD